MTPTRKRTRAASASEIRRLEAVRLGSVAAVLPLPRDEQEALNALRLHQLVNMDDRVGGVALQFADRAEAGRFHASLRTLMYAFGDAANPLSGTVHLMEELVVDYVAQVALQAAKLASVRPRRAVRGRPAGSGDAPLNVGVEDFLFALRKDPRKLARAYELLHLAAEIKQARSSTAMDAASLAGRAPAPAGAAAGTGKQAAATTPPPAAVRPPSPKRRAAPRAAPRASPAVSASQATEEPPLSSDLPSDGPADVPPALPADTPAEPTVDLATLFGDEDALDSASPAVN